MKNIFLLLSFFILLTPIYSQKRVTPPEPFGPLPTQKQLDWHEMQFYAFIHFSLNTFTNKEWGYGDESPQLFDPSDLDVRQWARTAKEAGMKGIILVAKHHDGFCLWPSAYTERSVKNSPWKNGKGDLVKELAAECKEYGLKLGLYLSPWDRNNPDYGKPAYITYFRNQLKELLTNYGDVFEMWFDGANGGDGYYGGANEIRKINTLEYYNWDETYELIYKIAPKTLVWGIGPSEARWIGNEEGYAHETNWSLLRQKDDLAGKVHYTEYMSGHEDGEKWVPGETNVSIRPGWFYHAVEDDKVHTLDEMVDFYYHSIGRNSTFLLNIPPDERGLIHENDIQRLKEYAAIIKKDFKTEVLAKSKVSASNWRGNSTEYGAKNTIDGNKETYWATDDTVKKASILFTFKKPTAFNRILLQEYIKLGQRVKVFTVEAKVDGEWQTIANETTIGYKRILRTKRVTASALRINIIDSKASIVISNIQAFNAPTFVRMPAVQRDKNGMVSMDSEAENTIYYTLDGTKPTAKSFKYSGSFKYDKAVEIKAISLHNKEKISSAIRIVKYGVSKENWKVVSASSGDLKTVNKIIDGNPGTTWGFEEDVNQHAQEVIIDLGNEITIKGFTYTPQQVGNPLNLISNYEFYSSIDGKTWTKQSEGEYSNIKNNPIEQIKTFDPVRARYLRFVAKSGLDKSKTVTIGELSIVE
ncbi:alpha-L-fucosidase [Flavobacterium sp. Fl-77]|uniref:alpha-L-fucosidase n=2 Tax=Flavobacterium flavipigmentatum TaxID=2893884 RepID=A0AAJ2SHL7_9FLAO|nr:MULTISPECIES: alpha-L-fucosidase [unclassified Flavobacterium]MDX6182632.1 alpha-L-fucosidase [Flavobacterium sp. Fl-33]MDX6186188.1 alpha-L-fucosidase [Flavobacterium sp. Fl-77]